MAQPKKTSSSLAVRWSLPVLIVTLLGGWMLHSWQSTNLVRDGSRADQQVIPTATPVPKDSLYTFTNDSLGLAFEYPKTWGEAAVAQAPRNRAEFEPVKTTFITFSAKKDVRLKISPSNWSFTGGQGEWDFPATAQSFQAGKNDASALNIVSFDDMYVRMSWMGIDSSVTLEAIKQMNLTKASAKYVELAWDSVSDACAGPSAGSGKMPAASCYPKTTVDETVALVRSMRTN